MKKTFKIMLALLTLCAMLLTVSCGNQPEAVTLNVKIVDDTADGAVMLDTSVTLNEAEPTVMSAFISACEENSVSYTLEMQDTLVASVEDKYDSLYMPEKDETDENTYWWYYTLNGEKPSANDSEGGAAVKIVENGDEVVWHYAIYADEK